ncbi:pyruvate dehydrogenase complex dihydrolipoamide acetyltransferase [Novosphingopyxis iocasae]|uniref:pyruvate dehydrogenase complex dihydrolipoamide acetyltransferase n=1 Tax=Novosphingopyxis iocasae TaxID=2762729 RepID=UPI00165169A4|nr:pyruvate dehydrogenase complex dihydrolipoamide acetyltransferase [Novosphingopyxis iocasae]
MPIELKMPALSPTMEEGTLAKWLVKEGDTVSSGDIMAEIETDKATMEFEAVDEGTIAKILIEEGTDEVKVGAVIAILAEEGEDLEEAAKAASGGGAAKSEEAKTAQEPGKEPSDPNKTGDEDKKAERSKTQAEDHGKPTDQAVADDGTKAPAAPTDDSGERIKASPLARRIAAQKGLDLTAIEGSGPKGRIVKADVADAKPTAKSAEAPAAKAEEAKVAAAAEGDFQTDIPHEAENLSNMRKTIARRLTEAKQTIPHIYLTVDVQLDKLLKLRSDLNKALEPQGIKLSVNDMLIKALAKALIQVPKCNVSYAGNQLIKYSRADISVAVSTPTGLITPIVTGAETKALGAISQEVKELAGRAKEGKLKPEEYQGGTASISNMGMFGIKQFDAVINPPQGMILAVGAGEKRPYIVDDALSVATVMSATGSFDHRAIDGADGAELMQAFKQIVENPLAMVA